jgi:P27 family predicted phage terminase small subunit
MGQRGTKPKPNAIKKAEGVRKSRINFDEPVVIPLSINTEPPERFTEKRQKELWFYFLGLFHSMHILSNADQYALEELIYHKWLSERAEKEVKAKGEVITLINKAKEEYLTENPWVNIKIKSSDRVMKILTQFGLTPSSRSSLKIEKPKEKKPGLSLLKKPAAAKNG